MEEYTHVLTGVTLSLTMTFPWDWNACEIPSDWSAGGSGSGGTGGGGGTSLLLKVNNVDNVIQTILNITAGANMTITDLGDGRVQFDATGDIGTTWGTIGGLLADQLDLQSALNLKADISSLADVAFSGDYNDLKNQPTIPDASTFVPYTGATANVNIGGNKFIADDGSDNSQMSPSLFGVQNSDTTKYSYLDKTGLNVTDSSAGDTMNVNAGGLTFPDATSQYSAAVNSDWNAVSGLAEILNKPTIPDVLDDLNDVKVPSPNDGEVLTYDTATGFWVSAPAPTASQGFQDVLIQDSVLTQANVIDASGFNFEIQDIYDLNLTGSYRGTIKSTIPSSDTTQGLEYGADFVKIECQNNTTSDYGQIQVNSQGIGISTQSGTDLTAINMSPTQIGIRTPNVVDGIASVGQVLTLQNATTGDVEYTSAGVGDMTKAVYDTDDDGVVDFAKAVKTKVRNSTGAVLHKGHIVYLSGSTGNVPNAVYAQANNDANSAQTFGVVYEDIANNSDGFVVMLGAIDTLDTRTTAPNPFTSDTLVDGQVIYLSPTTAGHVTNVKPSAPNHLVYVGYVIRTSPTNGTIEYRIQNGYELDELHDVVATAPVDNDYMYYDSSTSLYRLRQLTAARITDSTSVGQNLVKLTNPSAIRYLRINADNSVSALTASQLKSDLGFITQIQSTQLTNSSSSINVTISGCTIALEANTNYTGKMTIASGSVPVLGYTLVFNFPTGTTIRAGRLNSSSSTTAQVMLWQEMTSGVAFGTQFGNAQNQSGYAEIQLYISVGSTAGNFTQDFRSGSNGSAITIYAGLTSIQLQKV
jgi:hypothetical protein